MRIVTYNIRGGLGIDNIRSTERIANFLASLTPLPDIICLQEVHERTPWASFINQPAELRRLLPGYKVTMMRCIDLKVGGYGIATLSQLPILHTHRHKLPQGLNLKSEPRGLLEIELEDFIIFNTHWGLSEEERLEQGKKVAKIIQNSIKPVVLCGDFNELEDSEGVKYVRETCGLSDADTLQNRFTYATNNPTARIDFILHSPTLICENIEIIDTQVSDHFPLIADFCY